MPLSPQEASDRISRLEAELAAVRDVAAVELLFVVRGVGNPASALESIQLRAYRALNEDK